MLDEQSRDCAVVVYGTVLSPTYLANDLLERHLVLPARRRLVDV